MKNRKNISKIAVLGATIALTAAACGSDDADVVDDPTTTEAMADTTDAMADTTDAMDDSMTETTDAMDDSMTETTDAMDDSMTETTDAMDDSMTETTDAMDDGAMEEGAALEPSGDLCAAVPADGAGSFAGMTEDPAATAASNNPALSTLVAAVTAAGLVDTLNSDGPFTIFAPANPAFDAFSQEELDALLADTDTLTSVLTLHVVAGEKLSSADLAEMDTLTTVNGEDITIEAADDGTITVNGQATVGCADVATANATVHIIDAVLMPAG